MGTALSKLPYDYPYVVLRSLDQVDLFNSDDQRKQMLELIQLARRRTGIGICIIAYCLLAHEIHFVLRVVKGTDAKSLFVQRIKSQYARRVLKGGNGSAAVRKHLFERNYPSENLELSKVPEIIEHLHQLPVKQGLPQHQNTCLWSSRRAHLRAEQTTWITVDWYLESDTALPFSLPLSEAAAQQLVGQLIAGTAQLLQVPSAELTSRSHQATLARAVVAYHAIRCGIKLKRVTLYLNQQLSSRRSHNALSQAIKRYEARRPDLFNRNTLELLAAVPRWRRSQALLVQDVQDSQAD